MPKVEIVNRISGTRNGESWPAPGETLDVSDDEAETLIRQGNAKLPETKSKKGS